MVMSAVMHGYRDIGPVTLEMVGGAVSSTLYCEEVEGLPVGLVESFLVELYRCKLCQFTCGLKSSISSHLQIRHRPAPTLAYIEDITTKAGGRSEDRGDTTEHQREGSPYQLDLNGESKQGDEDEDFLLYNMLDNMSPPTCDISSEGGLQVAHTCEVTTLFEEESSIFPLKEGSVDLSCHIEPPDTQEDTAQSAHLMTLGLCRISSTKAPPLSASSHPTVHPPPSDSPHLSQACSLKMGRTVKRQTRNCSRKPRLLCLLCPATLPSRRLLDVHVRSHRAAGGFGCLRCSRKTDSWEELEPHWRSHCRKKEHKQVEEKKKEQQTTSVSRTYKSPVSPNVFKISKSQVDQRPHDDHSDRHRRHLIGRTGQQQEDDVDRLLSSQSQNGSVQRVTEKKKRAQENEEGKLVGYFCTVCHRKFSSRLTLRRHMGIHQGDKPFTCTHCSYSSRLKASLLQHLRTHTGEKPYRCPQCPYASIDHSSLLRHYRTHSKEKPYKCQHCHYSSIQKKSLDLHTRRHHTGQVFPCQQCNYSSPDRQLLLRHARKHHAVPQHGVA